MFEEQELALLQVVLLVLRVQAQLQALLQVVLQALLQGLRVQAQALHWWCQ